MRTDSVCLGLSLDHGLDHGQNPPRVTEVSSGILRVTVDPPSPMLHIGAAAESLL